MTTYAPAASPAPPAPPALPALPARAVLDDRRLGTARLAVTIALIVAVVGLFATVGADADWLAALGHVISARGAIPRGVPFAAAPTAHWPNTLVLAELILGGLRDAFGNDGLLVAQVAAVAVGLSLLARDARAGGAGAPAVAGGLFLIALGAFSSLAVARVQLFSLVLFPVMVLLLRAEARSPSRRIWLAIPLLAVWSNLHGAALSGLVILYLYLALSRFRTDRRTAVAVALAALPALCLTPAGVRTITYYHGLLTNLAAERGVGQWAPFGHSVFDWVLLVAAALLAVRLRRLRPPLWELAVLVLLAALTVKAGRNGVWLLFFLLAPATRATPTRRAWTGLLPLGALAALALLVVDVGHWSAAGRDGDAAVRQAIVLAHGTPILADGLLAEEVAVDGGRIWAGNPIDAFSRSVQSRYLDWLAGDASGAAALANPGIQVVLATKGSPDERLSAHDRDFIRGATIGGAVLFTRGGS